MWLSTLFEVNCSANECTHNEKVIKAHACTRNTLLNARGDNS